MLRAHSVGAIGAISPQPAVSAKTPIISVFQPTMPTMPNAAAPPTLVMTAQAPTPTYAAAAPMMPVGIRPVTLPGSVVATIGPPVVAKIGPAPITPTALPTATVATIASGPSGYTWDACGYWRPPRVGETAVSPPGYVWDVGGFWRRPRVGETAPPSGYVWDARGYWRRPLVSEGAPVAVVMPPTTTPDASPDQSMVNVDATVPTPSTTPAIAKYKGCYSRLHKTHGTYSIYCPIGRQPPAGASTAGLFGAFGALAETVTPAPPAGTVKVADEATQPPGTIPAGTEDTRPFYKSPWFWAGVIGVAAVGGGGFLYYRRRRHV